MAAQTITQVAGAVRRRTGPALAVVSSFGWAVIGAAAAAWWAGLAGGWVEAAVVAGLLTVVLTAAVGFVLGRLRYRVTVDLAQARVTVGDRAVGRLDVRNETSRALLPSVLELVVGTGVATLPVPRLAPGAGTDEIFSIPTQRRAVIPVGPVRSVRADPFGLMRRHVEWAGVQELFVHPRTLHLGGSSAGFRPDLEGKATRDISTSDVAFHALREYVPGDDRRHIHWKTTARTGRLMVRQFEETRRSHLAVILSTRLEDYADPAEFELAVSACGSLGLQALREDRGLTVLVQGGTLRGTHRTRLLDDLSRVELQPSRVGLADLARAAGQAIADVSVVALVCGSTVGPTALRSASAGLPVTVRALAVRCCPGAPAGRRAVAELEILTIGELGEFAAALRRLGD